MSIQINVQEIIIRPSSIDTFYNCSYQWAKTFLEGVPSIPGNRAAMGTAIHKAAQVTWESSIKAQKKDLNATQAKDAAVAEYEEELKKGVQFDDGETKDSSIKEILLGTEAYLSDIAVYVPIPVAVEQRFTIDIDHSLVKAISGTVDYITKDTISDIKTGKRKATTSNYTTQQSVYKMLAMANGVDVKHNTIQNVVLKASPEGSVLPMETDVEQGKALVNTLLDTLDVAMQDKIPLEVLFRGNPRYMLCSNKYCNLYSVCPYVNGELRAAL